MSKIIVALDYTDPKRAEEMVLNLGDSVDFYKVGLELFLNSRGTVLDFLKKENKKIFLDLKFHDIPNTVAQAAKWAADLEVEMFNVHASGGREMQKMTVDAVSNEAIRNGVKPPLLIAVTVLTSFDEEGFEEVGFKKPINESALQLARISQETGMDGVVCSALESKSIKNAFGKDFLTVCPGVRPLWSASQDQKRIVTPSQAKENLADYIVVGRPITGNEDPVKAALMILEELNN
jgi:orotidine-5'-phosphate decarboxylase